MRRGPDEARVIAEFRRALGLRGAADDAELGRVSGTSLIASVDSFVSLTDMPPSMSLRNAARKALVACVSDFAAKGARPHLALVSVTLRRGTTLSAVRQMASGIADGADEFGVSVLGGDTGEGAGTSITVCAIGAAPSCVPRRSGARAGDAVMATGPFGLSAAGLAAAMSRRRLRGSARFMARARRALLRPVPPLEFCARSAASFTSSMDSSDGLAATLWEMSTQSRVRLEIDAPPVAQGVREFAKSNNFDPMDLVLYGGEEYETVFTCRPAARATLRRRAARLGVGLLEIGRVMRGRGVYVADGPERLTVSNLGWRHLSNS